MSEGKRVLTVTAPIGTEAEKAVSAAFQEAIDKTGYVLVRRDLYLQLLHEHYDRRVD